MTAPSPTGGRVALVTGAAQGIGAAVAERLAQAGHPVVLLDRSETGAATAERLCQAGHDATFVALDVAREAEVGRLPDLIGERWDRLGILVNNAGISPKVDGHKRAFAAIPSSEWQAVLDVNLSGPFLVSRLCAEPLMARGWGRIVMMTSIAAHLPSTAAGAYYGASKAGLLGLARNLAQDLGPFGITVNCVSPGRIAGEMVAAADPDVNRAYMARIPLRRFGEPRDVAEAVAFLASDAASYVTGATIDVSGGLRMP